MTVVSRFRFWKVQQVGLASFFRTGFMLCSNDAVTPKDTPDPDAPLNFGFYGREVCPSVAAVSGPQMVTRNTAGLSAPAGALRTSTNLIINEGGMA